MTFFSIFFRINSQEEPLACAKDPRPVSFFALLCNKTALFVARRSSLLLKANNSSYQGRKLQIRFKQLQCNHMITPPKKGHRS